MLLRTFGIGVHKAIAGEKTEGCITEVKTCWWLKINTKPVRTHALDGAIFPYIIKVEYRVNGTTYFRRKWIGAGKPVPRVGETVTVVYPAAQPGKGEIVV